MTERYISAKECQQAINSMRGMTKKMKETVHFKMTPGISGELSMQFNDAKRANVEEAIESLDVQLGGLQKELNRFLSINAPCRQAKYAEYDELSCFDAQAAEEEPEYGN